MTVDGECSPETDRRLRLARPPLGHDLVHAWTLRTSRELLRFRADLRDEVAGGAGREFAVGCGVDDVVLVASELATNGLRHGSAPARVELLRRGSDLLLDVADHDLTWAPRLAGRRAPGLGGFGLHIVAHVAGAVGWYRSDATKHVWALFPAAGAVRT